jgi:hypothetical protein
MELFSNKFSLSGQFQFEYYMNLRTFLLCTFRIILKLIRLLILCSKAFAFAVFIVVLNLHYLDFRA